MRWWAGVRLNRELKLAPTKAGGFRFSQGLALACDAVVGWGVLNRELKLAPTRSDGFGFFS